MYESGSYTEWNWSPEHQQSYRQYQDTEGQWQIQWETELTQPRTPDVDGVTQSLQGVDLGGYQATNGDAYGQNVASSSSRSKSKSKHKSSSRKGKEYVGPEDDGQEAGSSSMGSAYANPASYGGQDSLYAYPEEEPYDVDLHNAINDSRLQNYGVYPGGEPSGYGYDTAPEKYEPPAAATPTASSYNKNYITGTPGDYEQLDPRYRVEASWKFSPGEIFKVHWAEPGGGNSEGAPSISDKQIQRDQFGMLIHVGFRRYIVVANETGHATCVPIFTYGGKACTKRGVKPESHGIIRDAARSRVRPLPNEPPLGFPPVKATLYLEGEHLAKESRINYSKFITVEHNVKVLFIGRINDDDFELVADAVNASWERKDRHRKKRHR